LCGNKVTELTDEKYRKLYEIWTEKTAEYLDNIERPEYKAEAWYSFNRNEIALDMIGDKFQELNVLMTGGAFWVENELCKHLKFGSLLRTDLIESPGINQVVDASTLPYGDKTFGAVICREVIEHVKNDSELLSEANRVLRDNGYLFITTPNCFNVLPDGVLHVRAYTPLTLEKRLNEFGFKILVKRGNVPNIHHSLLPLCRFNMGYVLKEFQDLAEMTRGNELLYYLGSEMFVLCQKERDANTISTTNL
jgi:SAM-dependent methyltransferase